MRGETFTISGRINTKFRRTVILQYKTGKKWKRLTKRRTTTSGKFSFATATTTARRSYRVVAPRTGVYPQATSKIRTVTTVGQSVSMRLPTSVYVNQSVRATVTAKPARALRPVGVQVLVGSRWTNVSSGVETSSGVATISMVATKSGTYSYRPYAPSWRHAPAVAGPAVKVTVRPDQTVADPNTRPLSDDEAQAITDFDPTAGTVVLTSAPASAANITVGKIIPIPPLPEATSGALRKVTKITRSGSTTTLATTGADLPEVIDHTADGAASVGLSVLSSSFTPADGVTVESLPATPGRVRTSGLQPTSIDLLKLKVNKHWDGAAGSFADLTGNVSISPFVDLDLDVGWSGLKGYKFGAGVEVANSLTASAGVKAEASQSFTLGTLTQTKGGLIGPVPVWVDATFKLVAEFSESGSVTVTVEASQTGKVSAGLTNKSKSDLTPKVYTTTAKTTSAFAKVEAAGKLTGFIGPQVDLMLYSAAGPYAKLGAKAEATINYTPPSSFNCAIKFGAYAEAGLKTSDVLKKLTGKSFNKSASTDFATTTLSGCPEGTSGGGESPLSITSVLSNGSRGTPYNQILTATGGKAPYSWSASGLPAGLSLANDTITGTPSSTGAYEVSITVTDASSDTATTVATIDIARVRVAQIATGASHSCALTDTGTVKCWGYNYFGQLGDGTTVSSAVPVAVDQAGTSALTKTAVAVADLGEVKAIATGDAHSCALTESGTVECWGDNAHGQLGDGTTAQRVTPVSVAGLTSVKSITAAKAHTCAVISDNTVKCWGANYAGQLGDGGTSDRHAPADVSGITDVKAITSSGDHTCALSNAGTVACWGGLMGGDNLVDIQAIAAGGFHTCALTNVHSAKCWGANNIWSPEYGGQLGDGTTIDRATPVDVLNLTDARAITAGWAFTCALTTSDTAECWGANDFGQLGDGTSDPRSTPVEVLSLTQARSIAAGGWHTCVVTKSDAVKCWGNNSSGQLGDGTTTNSNKPVEVAGLG